MHLYQQSLSELCLVNKIPPPPPPPASTEILIKHHCVQLKVKRPFGIEKRNWQSFEKLI